MKIRKATEAARTGFTLMEMLVVAAIILVLAGVGAYYLMPRVDETKEKRAKIDVTGLTQMAESYKLNNDDYPPTLHALTEMQPGGGAPFVEPGGILDPWGQPYLYDPTGPNNRGLKPDIWCNRPNGPIGNWTRR